MLIENTGVSWAIFPEMTFTGFTMNINKCGENISCSTSIDFFTKQAVKHNIYLSFGMILKSETKATNNLITILPTGEIFVNYIKIHPFSYVEENKYYDKGTKLCKTMVSDALVGFSICYDLRSGLTHNRFSRSGISFSSVPSNYT